MNYYISDLHFGQDNIMYLEGRPFKNLEDMEHAFIERWNNCVSDGDTVYVLGDFVLRDEEYLPEYTEKLNGKIVLIRGNHDPEITTPESAACFEKISDYLEIDDCGRHVIMCHYPIPFYKNDYDENTWMLYGHVHNTREYEFMRRLRADLKVSRLNPWRACGNLINVGCMMPWMDYTPRTLDELIESNT